ncbi:hypothetical protein [Rhizobium sp. MHM7A]|uniref:hypothetical protein n=1 Tax=Rhizobium sp. MHM7A TaxID=2583233 RepID=UPI001105BBDF|nr:hypothetical protein [Rhizobium sp. MHM7A]TLX16082.1 hypothetical protein FFR93_01810 [Rhizobium sp. MHM7A]
MVFLRILHAAKAKYRSAREKRAARKLGFDLVFAGSDLEAKRRISDKVFAPMLEGRGRVVNLIDEK